MKFFNILLILGMLLIVGLGGFYLYTQFNPVQISLEPDARFVNSEVASSKLLFASTEPDENVYSSDLIVGNKYQYVSPSDPRKIVELKNGSNGNITNITNILDQNFWSLVGGTISNSVGNYLLFNGSIATLSNSTSYACEGGTIGSGSCYVFSLSQTDCEAYNNHGGDCTFNKYGQCNPLGENPQCMGYNYVSCSALNESVCGSTSGCSWNGTSCESPVCATWNNDKGTCNSVQGCFAFDCYDWSNDEGLCNDSGLCEYQFVGQDCSGDLTCEHQAPTQEACIDSTSAQCSIVEHPQIDQNISSNYFYAHPSGSNSPYQTDSNILNINLNADLLDGYHADSFQPVGNYVSSNGISENVSSSPVALMDDNSTIGSANFYFDHSNPNGSKLLISQPANGGGHYTKLSTGVGGSGLDWDGTMYLNTTTGWVGTWTQSILTYPYFTATSGFNGTLNGKVNFTTGTSGAGGSPIKLTSSTSVLTTPEVGAMEFTDPNYFITSTGTLGSENFLNFNVANWSLTTGWALDNKGNTKIDHNANGLGSATFNGYTPVVGQTYYVTFNVDTFSTGNPIVRLGGVEVATISSVGNYSGTITAINTNKMTIGSSSSGRYSINAISIKASAVKRRPIALVDSPSGLTSSRIVLGGNNGFLTDSNNLTFDGNKLTAPFLVGNGSLLTNIVDNDSAYQLISQYLPATSINLVVGTSTNTIGDLNVVRDNKSYKIQEVSGTPAIRLDFNIRGVIKKLDSVLAIAKYNGSTSHAVRLQLWDYTSSTWETFSTIPNSLDYSEYQGHIMKANANHVWNGLVQGRLYHTESGNPSHDMNIDWVGIVVQ